jgi:raffinose/stachyose/melibiose transport system substrate-binding protein
MKKVTALFLVLCMILGLAACANDSGENAKSGGSDNTQDESAANSSSGEKITLTMAVQTGMQEYFTLADNYMAENQNITIEIEEYPTSEFTALLKAKLAGGECWDVFPLSSMQQPTMVKAGHVVDLSDMTDIIDRYKDPEMVRSSRTYDGIIAALPAQYQFMPLYYNRVLFEELGISVPTDYQQLLEVIKQANDEGLIPIAAGFKENWLCTNMFQQFAATYVQRDDPEWGEKRNNNETTFAETPGWKTTFDKIKDLIDQKAFSSSAVSTSDEQAMMSFLNGEALLYFNGTWGLNSILGAMPDGFELGGFRFPVQEPGEVACTSTSVTGDFAVWSGSSHIEEAKKWLAYTLSPEQNLIFNTTKGPSPFKDVDVPLNDALVEFEQTVADSGGKTAEWPIYQQRWPDGLSFEPSTALIQELFYPELAKSSLEICQEMDKAWDEDAAAAAQQ